MEYLGVFLIGFIFGAMFGAFIVLTGNSNESNTQYTAGGYQPKGRYDICPKCSKLMSFDPYFQKYKCDSCGYMILAKPPKGGTVQQDN